MGHWDDFRYEPLAGEYDVGICTSADGCRQGISKVRHTKGYADRFGTIHWTRWTSRPTRKRGLHRLLSLIAVVKLQHHRRANLPVWKALHERFVWAQHQGEDRFHVRFPIAYSHRERELAREDVKRHHVPTRSIDPTAYLWMHAETYKENRSKR